MKTAALVTGFGVATTWSYLQHIRLPKPPSRLNWSMLVFGHRGCRGIAGIPENTIPAFEYAHHNAAAGIELDVRVCGSGELVVHHDAFVAPLCDAIPGVVAADDRIADLPLEKIKQLSYAADPTKTIRVPTLEEAIHFCRDNYLKMLIEVKEVGTARVDVCVDRLLDLYHRDPKYMYEQTTVICFNPVVLYKLRKRDPKIAVCLLSCKTLVSDQVKKPTEVVPAAWRACPRLFDFVINWISTAVAPWVIGVSMAGPHFREMTDALQARWNRRGVLVYLWGFKEPTDCPDWMRTPGLFVAVDDKHVQYYRHDAGAQKRSPREQESGK